MENLEQRVKKVLDLLDEGYRSNDVQDQMADRLEEIEEILTQEQEIKSIREAPEGSRFMTLFVAYLFEDSSQFLMYDEGETDLRDVIDEVHGSPVSLLAWNRRSGFPAPQDFEKFQREVSEELGDIPFVYPDEE